MFDVRSIKRRKTQLALLCALPALAFSANVLAADIPQVKITVNDKWCSSLFTAHPAS